MIKILFIGDIVGRPGRNAVKTLVPRLREELALNLVIANSENAAAGAGITAALSREIQQGGVDAITLGDHTWDQRGFEGEIDSLETVCRPANMAEGCPGRRYVIVPAGDVRVAVFTMLGRNYLPPRDCPFREADRLLDELKGRADVIIAEIHAEATSEKIAFGRYLDGRVAAVVGTHTHVPTADGTIFPGGTAYLTDLGMTGPYESVLGRAIEPVIQKFLDGMPRRFDVASGDVRLAGVLLTVNEATGRCEKIEQVIRSLPVDAATG